MSGAGLAARSRPNPTWSDGADRAKVHRGAPASAYPWRPMPASLPPVLRPLPAPSPRPWAGPRLGGAGELWLAGPGSTVALPDGMTTLDDLARNHGEDLVGRHGMARLGARFPLLVKLIDAGDWLSLQVHPSDTVARRLHGADAVGKAEAWVVLESGLGAQLITGPRTDLSEAELRTGILAGTLGLEACETRPAVAGDVFHLPAGTIHAIGAGVLVYEIEQPSDWTYRISDWGRPPVPGRHLHPRQAIEAVVPGQTAVACGSDWRLVGGALAAPAFQLELLGPGGDHDRAPGGRCPEIVSVVGGTAMLRGDRWSEPLAQGRALVVPAACPAYRISVAPGARVLLGSLPG